MGKLITIVGNSGTGKTTLAGKLCEIGRYDALLEQHQERPYQEQFSNDLKRFSLSNQIDYLLFRAEQEIYARKNEIIGVQDGGLEQDFHGFTKLFYRKGYLDEEGFRLCERLYGTLRQILPMPDLIISLSAPGPVLVRRRANRNRDLDITRTEDLETLEGLLQDWVSGVESTPVLHLDTSVDDPAYEHILDDVVYRIDGILNLPR
jgi:deoxyadenosine/deoxycytidine kinase